MHRFVFEDRVDRLGAVEQRIAGALELRVHQHVDDLTVGFVRELLDGRARRPDGRVPLGGSRGVPGRGPLAA